ncbi:hypothetical protein C2S51_021071 [Perilla frutescens var. frutescens]|nr:hypothetical protein C2S51_021071 [Perilla frutescens var. frutescens]
MKINKISKKLIKPHTPTPPNLKNYNISFLDKNLGAMNIAVVLFYQSKPENVNSQLEESLAKILVQFYLLAGRYMKNDHLVDCSDQGVEFVVAEALDDDDGVELTELVAKTTDAEQINGLLPDQYFRVDEASHDPLMSIQATHFPCGGLAIAVSISHRVFDVSSLGTFIAAWSNTCNPDNKMVELTTPSFELPLLLPYKDHDFGIHLNKSSTDDHDHDDKNNNNNIVVKRLLFNKAALTSLKSKIRPKNGKTVSGVRVVCAVIAKALIRVDRAKHGRNRDMMIFQPVNMRERTIPPQSKHACGNLSLASLTRRVAASEAGELGVEELVDLIGDAVRKSIGDHAEILSATATRDGRDIIANSLEMLIKVFMNPEMNVVVFTDWSRFGFYEADFGWGKPLWLSIGPQRPTGNSTVLMSNKDGDGIEAWLHLNQTDMHCFYQDEEIKLFTT